MEDKEVRYAMNFPGFSFVKINNSIVEIITSHLVSCIAMILTFFTVDLEKNVSPYFMFFSVPYSCESVAILLGCFQYICFPI